jgi:acyl-coenzyme A thioesterase PaaI-like protein
VHQGKSVVFTEASLLDDEGQLLARASGTARVVRLER